MAGPEGPELLNQKDYARRKGWSKQYVHQLVKKGRIPLKDGRIDPEAADAALARDRDPARVRAAEARRDEEDPEEERSLPDTASQDLQRSFSKARTVREHYRAIREKLELQKETKELLYAPAVDYAIRRNVAEMRDSIRYATRDLAHKIAAKYGLDDREVVQLTAETIDAALTQFSDRLLERSRKITKGDFEGLDD